jgi:hypothetical protein
VQVTVDMSDDTISPRELFRRADEQCVHEHCWGGAMVGSFFCAKHQPIRKTKQVTQGSCLCVRLSCTASPFVRG